MGRDGNTQLCTFTCVHIHSCTCTNMYKLTKYKHAHAHKHRHTHRDSYAYMHTHKPMCICTFIHMKCTYTLICIYTYMGSLTYIHVPHTYAHSHPCICAHTCTHACLHTQAPTPSDHFFVPLLLDLLSLSLPGFLRSKVHSGWLSMGTDPSASSLMALTQSQSTAWHKALPAYCWMSERADLGMNPILPATFRIAPQVSSLKHLTTFTTFLT